MPTGEQEPNANANRLGCILAIARAVASLVLGVVVFVAMLYFVALSGLSSKLLDHEFYESVLDDVDFYERVHEQAAQEIHEEALPRLGGIEVLTPEDSAQLLREIAPPSYLEREFQRTIRRVLAYLREDTDQIGAYVDLGPPLERVRPVLLTYIDERIDAIELEESGPPDCSSTVARRLAAVYYQRFQQLADGHVPTSLPSLRSLPGPCRSQVFQAVYPSLGRLQYWGNVDWASLEGDLRLAFESGDAREVLRVMAHSLAGSRIDSAIQDVRQELSPGDRLGIIRLIADEDENLTEREIRTGFAEFRDLIGLIRGLGKTISLVVVIVGGVLLGFLYLPNLSGVVRWPGVTLLLSGLVCLIGGLVMRSGIRGWIENSSDLEVAGISASRLELANDLTGAVGQQLATGFVVPAIVFMVIGGVLLAASFALPRVMERWGRSPREDAAP